MGKVAVYAETIYLAGLVAANLEASSTEQTEQIPAQIDGFLAAAGTNKSGLLVSTIVLSDLRN
jgi:hypothetical protein